MWRGPQGSRGGGGAGLGFEETSRDAPTMAMRRSGRVSSHLSSVAKRSSTVAFHLAPLTCQSFGSASYSSRSASQPSLRSSSTPSSGLAQSHGIGDDSCSSGRSTNDASVPNPSTAVCIVRRSGDTTTSSGSCCSPVSVENIGLDKSCRATASPAEESTASSSRYWLVPPAACVALCSPWQ